MDASDTSPEAAEVQRQIWARLGPSGRLELALAMSDDVRELSIDGVQARCPGLTRRQAELEVIRRVLGDELFEAAYGGLALGR